MTAFVTVDQANAYLRQDSDYENDLISGLIIASENECRDVARMTSSEWEAIASASSESANITINGQEYSGDEQVQLRELIRVAVLYALGYLYEHRTEADHHDLIITLRNLLFSVREGVF